MRSRALVFISVEVGIGGALRSNKDGAMAVVVLMVVITTS